MYINYIVPGSIVFRTFNLGTEKSLLKAFGASKYKITNLRTQAKG